ncbi:MAG: TonB-dependent receptor [Bacteroides sp.]|nr:TonB-dependent receptor [Bacteroides sp.]
MEKGKKRLFQALPLAMGLLLAGGNVFASPLSVPSDEYSVNQQANRVTGVVSDANGDPLVGVNVVEKGSAGNGSITDVDGKFALNVSPNATLVFSYIGYTTQEVALNGRRNLNVTLTEDSETLDEVVVIGYGVVRKADLAGSVAVMDNKSFKDQPITQVSDALQGRVAGVTVVSDGLPGGSVKIRIRGNNSINKSNDPLYVVDGMVRESGLEGINPEDIQSMQILKDASSTAIYGSRGANGVVIITTKTGRKGESHITFDAAVGVSNAIRLPEMMDTKSYAQALVDYNNQSATDLEEYLNGTNPGIDWVDTMFRTGVTQNYKLVFSKGTEGMQAYISGNYMKHEGVIEKSKYERYSAKANIKTSMTKWLDVTLDLNASRGIGKGIGELAMGGYNPLWIAFNSSPTMTMKDEDGNYNNDPYGTIQNNAYGIIADSKNERRRDVFSGHVDLKFNIIKGLTFTTSNGIDYYNNTSYSFSPKSVSTTHDSNSMANNNSQRVLLQSSNNLTYTNNWDKHFLTVTGVWEATKSDTRAMGISGSSLQTESVGWWNVKNAATREASNSYSDWALLSGVGRAIYSYDNRYMLTATFRADGSSRFTNNKWGYFPSVAVAWTASNEAFMEKYRDVVSNLKIRASYGIIGNQDIDPYSTLALMETTTTYFGTSTGVTGYWANTVATPDIKWEKTKQFDFGFDLGLFDNRIDFSFDYFNKRTSDALLTTNLANYLGGTSYLINAGEVSNKGFDLSLTANIIQNNEWSWSTTITGTYLKNKVEKLTAQEPIIYGGSFQSIITESTIIKEGEAIGTFYGYRWAGIDSDGYDTYYTADGEVTRSPATTDRVVLGKATPDFTLGWNNSVRYKNWSLNAFFNGAFGVQRLNALRFAMNSMIGNARMFTDANFISEIGKTMPNPNVENNQYLGNSSKWIENASYFRCENISLSYDFPKSMTKFVDLRLSFSVQNLFTITGYKGSNPAGFSFASSEGDRSNGIDTGTYPTTRTFTFGVRMNF